MLTYAVVWGCRRACGARAREVGDAAPHRFQVCEAARRDARRLQNRHRHAIAEFKRGLVSAHCMSLVRAQRRGLVCVCLEV